MHSQRVTPSIESAVCTWYTRSWGAHNVTVKLLKDFPVHHPEPGHTFFDNDETVQQILARPDLRPYPVSDGTPRTLALVVRRWVGNGAPDCIVGMSWYI